LQKGDISGILAIQTHLYMITIEAQTREITGKKAGSRLAADGLIPAVLYGAKRDVQSISIPLAPFKKVLRDAGESTVIEISGLGGSVQALIHEVDLDPVTNLPRHVDFLAVAKGAKVEVAVPLTFTGEAPAVKAGARLVKVMHELLVSADAAHLPHEIEVDISTLENDGDQIHVRDLKLPNGVEVKEDGEEVVALTQIAEDEPEEAVTLDIASIEVEKKGKTEEEAA
jgi:large subunit ribosomal protein L25